MLSVNGRWDAVQPVIRAWPIVSSGAPLWVPRLLGGAVSVDRADVAVADEELAYSIGVQAYVWGYPLVVSAVTAMVVTATDRPLSNGHAPFNQFGHVAKLFTAKDRDVVSSNVDTVYSSAFLDLGQGAAVVSVPATAGRYYSLMLEDAYTNVFGYIGSRATGDGSGRYALVRAGFDGVLPSNLDGVIEAPTNLVWVIGRTLVDDEQDLLAVSALQQQIGLEIIAGSEVAPPVHERWTVALQPKLAPVEQVDAMSAESFFRFLGDLMADNPGPQSDQALTALFERIGLGRSSSDGGDWSDSTRAGLQRAFEAGRTIVQCEALKTGSTQANGWAFNLSQGRWGLDFLLRASIARRSLGQNTPEEALYFNTRQDSNAESLDGNFEYTITFAPGQLPPVGAFWSITMYDATDFFVDNLIDRYAIGIRTPGLRTEADGSLTIHIGRNRPSDEEVSNWLPAPDGAFRLSLRLYNPLPAVLNREWTPPAPVRRS